MSEISTGAAFPIFTTVENLYFLLAVFTVVNICSHCPLVQAIMLFSISGSRTESMGDKINAYNMYNQTLHLIKYVMKLTTSKNAKKDTDLR